MMNNGLLNEVFAPRANLRKHEVFSVNVKPAFYKQVLIVFIDKLIEFAYQQLVVVGMIVHCFVITL